MRQEYEYFMRCNPRDYIGNWIAIVDDEIVASGKDIKKIHEKVKREYPQKKPLFTRIPDKETMIL